MNKRNPDPGYRLPEEIEPEGVVCIRAYVPDAPEYIAAFWGSYSYLTKWLAWERNENKDAKIAAELWRQLFYRSRDEFECSGGECGIMDVRQRDGYPCLLDKKTDCEDWEQFADLRLCVPKMRFLNGVIQQDVTGNGDWVNAGDPEVPYDDRNDGPYTPAWTEPPEGQDGACLAALNAIAFMRGIITAYANMLDTGVNAITALLYWTSTVTIVAAIASVIVELTTLLNELMTGFTGDWGDVATYDFTADIQCILFASYSADGSMTGPAWADIGPALQDVIDAKTEQYQKTAIRLASLISFALGPVGMSRVASFAGIVEGDCTDCGTFEHTFDFTLSNGGWGLTGKDDHSCDLYGQYDTGNGWQVGDYGDNQHWYVLIASPEIDPTTITKIELDYIPSKVTNYAQLRNGVACPTPDPWDFLTDESNNTPNETGTIVWEGSITCHQIYAVMRNGGGGIQGDGNAWITEVRVYGNGADPWE